MFSATSESESGEVDGKTIIIVIISIVCFIMMSATILQSTCIPYYIKSRFITMKQIVQAKCN